MRFKDIQATIEIDLRKTEEELFNNADKKARWGVKRAEKEGLVVEEANNEKDINIFYEIYKETCEYGGINPEPLEKIKNESPLFFVCKKGEKIIAGAALKKKENVVILYLNCSLHEYLNLQPNNLLYWYIIKWAKEKGFSVFDLGGYQLKAKPGSKSDNINKFKCRWGGKLKMYYIYSKNPFYILGRKLVRNFRFFWWLNKKIKGRK